MANHTKETHSQKSQRPVLRVKMRGITASVFENESDKGVPFHKVSITRTYKDGDGFQSTTTFHRDDLPLVQEAAYRAWREIMLIEATHAADNSA